MKLRLSLFAILSLLPSACLHAADKPEKPNVLLIIADDQGYSDFGFTGNTVVKTPNIDRLSRESAVFKNFAVAAACSPSRAAIYTGRDHLATGVWGVPPRANLRRDEVMMPAFFQKDGYRTLHIGKADCTRTIDSQTWERGWDDAYLIEGGYVHRDPVIAHKDGNDKTTGWTADILTDHALDFIRSSGDKPWFLTLAYIIPHLPWVCDEKFSAPYLKAGLSQDLSNCYGCITQLDTAVGRLLEGLKASGQDKNTIVIYLSDNGMTNQAGDGENGSPKVPLSPEDWKIRDMHNLRGHKATVWENGIRVPLLVRWPGKITPGDRTQFGIAEDLLPTLLDLTGIAAASQPHLPFTGSSLRPALENPKAPDDHLGAFRMAIAFEGSPNAPKGIVPDPHALKYEDHHLTLRDARFKFHSLPGGKTALYDITADPCETTDVQAQYPEITSRMAAACRQRWDDIIATDRAFGMPVVPIGTAASRPQKAASLPCYAAQALTGNARVSQALDLRKAGDSATYTIDVSAPGTYKVTASGNHLDTASLTLTAGNSTLKGLSQSPDSVEFGTLDLKPGKTTVILAADTPPSQPASVKKIDFRPASAKE